MGWPTHQTSFSGAIDGENVIFYTEYSYWPGSVRVWLNGMKQWLGPDYYETLGGTKVEMVEPPQPGDDLIIDYILLELD